MPKKRNNQNQKNSNNSNNNNNTASSSDSAGSTTTATTNSSEIDQPTNFGNDYCDHFLRTGELPQSHIQNLSDPLIGYPKLQRLHELKAEHNSEHAGKAYGKKVPLSSMSSELNGWAVKSAQFDVVLIGGCIEFPPNYEQLTSLPIQRITPRPSILFIWVPGYQLETARAAMDHWGFRRSEDIMYFATDTNSLHYPNQDFHDAINKTTWHCLMGLKGTLRRSDDTDLINCNVDTDVIFNYEERNNVIPEKIYSIIENFSLMNRRLHIIPGLTSFGSPTRIRPGWVICSPDVMLDNYQPHIYAAERAKHAGHRIPVHPEIDSLRPKTPPKVKRK